MPLILPCVRDRRAIAAMFAVPSVPIEEHQMRGRATIHRFVHAEEVLHGGACSTLRLGLERLDRDPYDWSRCPPTRE